MDIDGDAVSCHSLNAYYMPEKKNNNLDHKSSNWPLHFHCSIQIYKSSSPGNHSTFLLLLFLEIKKSKASSLAIV